MADMGAAGRGADVGYTTRRFKKARRVAAPAGNSKGSCCLMVVVSLLVLGLVLRLVHNKSRCERLF